jgi:flagellar biosynthesis protein FlhG
MFNSISTQANSLINITKKKYKISKTKVVAITSGKGGVGKSTMTANIAYLLSQRGKKILVIDADIGLANMQILFDIKPSYTLYDYISNKAKLNDVLLKTKYHNVTLLAGKSGHKYAIESSSLVYTRIVQDVIDLNTYDIILIDTGAGINEYVKEFIDISDEVIAITTTDPSAITDAYALIKMISSNKNNLFILFNQTATFKTGEVITRSLMQLGLKNRINKNFMVKYIGNVRADLNISTTGRLRKLFTKEFSSDISAMDLDIIVNNLIREIK